jgi:DNA repair exonuclease SbcCD ATPase subunit
MKDVLKVELENIQAVKKASIEIEGFTAVVGRSNSGKSSFIRGMHAALTNKSPKTLFRTGTTQSRVKIEDEAKNISVEWKKGDKINAYVINGKEYTKVGKEVPKEIEEFGFKEIRVNDESLEVQFARQHEYIFLLNRSGGFIADFISKITKADVLTGAVKDCESDIRKCNDNLKAAQKEKDRLDGQLKRFTGVDKIETDIDETLLDVEKAVVVEQQVSFLAEVCSARDVSQLQIKILKDVPKVPALDFDVDGIRSVENYIQSRDRLKSELVCLSKIPDVPKVEFDIQILTSLQSWVVERDTHKNRYIPLKSLEGLSIPQVSFNLDDLELIDRTSVALKARVPNLPSVPDSDVVLEKLDHVQKLSQYQQEYAEMQTEFRSLNQDIKKSTEKLEGLLSEKKDLQKELGECPTCGRGFESDEEKDCSAHSG